MLSKLLIKLLLKHWASYHEKINPHRPFILATDLHGLAGQGEAMVFDEFKNFESEIEQNFGNKGNLFPLQII